VVVVVLRRRRVRLLVMFLWLRTLWLRTRCLRARLGHVRHLARRFEALFGLRPRRCELPFGLDLGLWTGWLEMLFPWRLRPFRFLMGLCLLLEPWNVVARHRRRMLYELRLRVERRRLPARLLRGVRDRMRLALCCRGGRGLSRLRRQMVGETFTIGEAARLDLLLPGLSRCARERTTALSDIGNVRAGRRQGRVRVRRGGVQRAGREARALHVRVVWLERPLRRASGTLRGERGTRSLDRTRPGSRRAGTVIGVAEVMPVVDVHRAIDVAVVHHGAVHDIGMIVVHHGRPAAVAVAAP